MNKKELKRVQVLMDKNLFKQLRTYAFKTESSFCEVARRALIKFLEEEKSNKLI